MSANTSRYSHAADTNPRGYLRSPLLELYVRSFNAEAKKKSAAELLPPSAARLRLV
jgi:hypothetical protein